jgi:hypothetical protein
VICFIFKLKKVREFERKKLSERADATFSGLHFMWRKIQKNVQKHDFISAVFNFIAVLYYLLFVLAWRPPPYPAEKNQASEQACQSARLLHATDEKACKQAAPLLFCGIFSY